MWYVKTKHLSEWWRRGVYLSECIPCASWVNVSEKPHKTTGSERASTAQKEPSESLRWEKSMSILSKKKMVFLQWALQGQSNFILCPSSPACKWRTTWFRLKKGAGTWPLAAPVWNPWADPNDPLSGFPVNYVRLLWFWSIPKLILCQIRKTDGEKKKASLGWDANLTYGVGRPPPGPTVETVWLPCRRLGREDAGPLEDDRSSWAAQWPWWLLTEKKKGKRKLICEHWISFTKPISKWSFQFFRIHKTSFSKINSHLFVQ